MLTRFAAAAHDQFFAVIGALVLATVMIGAAVPVLPIAEPGADRCSVPSCWSSRPSSPPSSCS